MECAFRACCSVHMSWVVLVFSPPLDRGVDFVVPVSGPYACPGGHDGCGEESVVCVFGDDVFGEGERLVGDVGLFEAHSGCVTRVAVRLAVDRDLECHVFSLSALAYSSA